MARMYEPHNELLQELRSRVSSRNWRQRVDIARAVERDVRKVLKGVKAGESQDAAIRNVVPSSRRSKMVRALQRYKEEGFEGLIDRRTPREVAVPDAQRRLICAVRRCQPEIRVSEIETLVEVAMGSAPSETTIKRILNGAGLARSKGRPQAAGIEVEELSAAGFELLKAAESQTSAVINIVKAIKSIGRALPKPGTVGQKERKFRNAKGQLTARYNRSRRKRKGEPVAPAYRTAAEKASLRDLGRVAIRTEPEESIEQKVWALISLPVLTRGTRLDELYGPAGSLLEGICGYAYMPETLRKTVSEWALIGAGPIVQQTVADTWHQVSSERWEEGYQASIVYVDNNVKPLWTQMFTRAAKVSSTGRVQPAVVSTFIHSGSGTPIYFESYSGSAPLAPRVLKLLERVESAAKQSVGRLTVIDGECCSAALLKAFKEAKRDLITPLSDPMIKRERFEFGRGNSPRPYRNGDKIREGTITLTASRNRSLQVKARAIVIERRRKKTWTVLVTLADRKVWSARKLADLYFERWPKQEGFFRHAKAAVGLDRIHGYGKRLVANTSVLTTLDETRVQIARFEEQISEIARQRMDLTSVHQEACKSSRAAAQYVAKREERVDAALSSKARHTARFERAVLELREGSKRLKKERNRADVLQRKLDRVNRSNERKQEQLENLKETTAKLMKREKILEADMAQDVLFTSLKVTLGMLIHFVVKEYFPSRPMEWRTFLSRIAMLRGRRETTGETITVTIRANERDLEMMQALERACGRINKRKLTRDGRRLRYLLEWG